MVTSILVAGIDFFGIRQQLIWTQLELSELSLIRMDWTGLDQANLGVGDTVQIKPRRRAGLMATEKRRRQESYGLDAINGSGSVATLETRRALQRSLRGEFIDHK
ncbi:hypothetical protein F2Q68_00003055 [Brassica cretica]|uniref:Uncharacterized protein n=1 Tax=Brassica cretica TaxID=69181 RepID=A0A8S9JBA5_BRACR|nr:hypothetical protein F2Q68_00003055 [Brassica cretica]